MADDPFPTPVARIGDRTYTLTFPEGLDNQGQVRTPYAHYTIELLDSSGNLVERETGILFEANGPDLLTIAEKNDLVAMDARLKNKAETRWVV